MPKEILLFCCMASHLCHEMQIIHIAAGKSCSFFSAPHTSKDGLTEVRGIHLSCGIRTAFHIRSAQASLE